jgi:hypothetical protein
MARPVVTTRPLSPAEMEEIDNMAAECDLNPERRRFYFAELIRLREFAAYAHRYRGSLPVKVRDAFTRNLPAKSGRAAWIEAGAEDAVEDELHQPPPVKPARVW